MIISVLISFKIVNLVKNFKIMAKFPYWIPFLNKYLDNDKILLRTIAQNELIFSYIQINIIIGCNYRNVSILSLSNDRSQKLV